MRNLKETFSQFGRTIINHNIHSEIANLALDKPDKIYSPWVTLYLGVEFSGLGTFYLGLVNQDNLLICEGLVSALYSNWMLGRIEMANKF